MASMREIKRQIEKALDDETHGSWLAMDLGDRNRLAVMVACGDSSTADVVGFLRVRGAESRIRTSLAGWVDTSPGIESLFDLVFLAVGTCAAVAILWLVWPL